MDSDIRGKVRGHNMAKQGVLVIGVWGSREERDIFSTLQASFLVSSTLRTGQPTDGQPYKYTAV